MMLHSLSIINLSVESKHVEMIDNLLSKAMGDSRRGNFAVELLVRKAIAEVAMYLIKSCLLCCRCNIVASKCSSH